MFSTMVVALGKLLNSFEGGMSMLSAVMFSTKGEITPKYLTPSLCMKVLLREWTEELFRILLSTPSLYECSLFFVQRMQMVIEG